MQVKFKSFTEKDYVQMVKWGYNVSGKNIANLKEVKAEIKKTYRDLPVSAFPSTVINWFKENQKPLTFFLSGGLDSSFIYSLFLKSGSTVPTEVLCLPNGDDSFYAKTLAGVSKVKLITPEKEVSDSMLLKMMRAQSSPMDLGSMQGNYHLFKEASNPIIVLGDGADEIFGGYTRHQYYDTTDSDKEELFYYHLPRLFNMSEFFGKTLYAPYLHLLKAKNLYSPGKTKLKGLARGFLPLEILERQKLPLKSADSKSLDNGLYYRAKLVKIWKDNL